VEPSSSTSEEVEAGKAALAKAEQRIADLEARLALELAQQRQNQHWLYSALEHANVGIWEWDVTLDKITWSDAVYRLYGLAKGSFVPTYEEYLKLLDQDREKMRESVSRTLASRDPHYYVEHRIERPDGTTRWVSSHGMMSYDEHGKPYRLAGAITDVTEAKRVEQERLAMQQRIIDAQAQALRELGAPIIPLRDRTLAMPLVGALTRERADQVTEALLVAVSERQAHVVLLDVTGVPEMDTDVAQALVRTAEAVRLLGASVVLTGVRPQVARALVGLDVDMGAFVIKADLQSGIEHAARMLDPLPSR